jgi:hypothetical protein
MNFCGSGGGGYTRTRNSFEYYKEEGEKRREYSTEM